MAESTPPEGTEATGSERPTAPPRPDGEPAEVVRLREMIEEKLSTMFPSYGVDDRGNYVLPMDTARIFVVPAWMKEGSTVLRIFAITNLDVPITADLTTYLLQKNLDFVFGAFGLDADAGAVWFNHNLLGEFAAPAELETSIAAVAQTADRYDNEIKTRFGGRLYTEAPDQAAPPTAPPGYL